MDDVKTRCIGCTYPYILNTSLQRCDLCTELIPFCSFCYYDSFDVSFIINRVSVSDYLSGNVSGPFCGLCQEGYYISDDGMSCLPLQTSLPNCSLY